MSVGPLDMTRSLSVAVKPPLTNTDGPTCQQCLAPVSDDWKTMCDECYSVREKRKCEVCDQMRIDADAPSWKNKCNSCYKDHIAQLLPCKDCNEPRIDPTWPSWRKQCGSCYKKDREKNYITCVGCIDDPKYATKLVIRRGSKHSRCRRCRIKEIASRRKQNQRAPKTPQVSPS